MAGDARQTRPGDQRAQQNRYRQQETFARPAAGHTADTGDVFTENDAHGLPPQSD